MAVSRIFGRFTLAGALAVLLCGRVLGAVCCDAATQSCLAPYEGNRLALVAGIDKYSGSPNAFANQLSDLTNAGNDAETVAQVLATHHYKVRCLLNPTIDQFNSELDKLKAHLKTLPQSGPALRWNDIIVHFSGHGFRVGNTDFLFLSGTYDKQQFRANAVRIDDLLLRFSEFSHLRLTFVIDACRNSAADQPNWSQGGFASAENYNLKKSEAHSLVFSASRGNLAHDANASIGANANGTFVHVAKKYMALLFADIELIYRLVAEDADMNKISQAPDIHVGSYNQEPPLGGADYFCILGSAAARQFGACSRSTSSGPPCDEACNVRDQYKDSLQTPSRRHCTLDMLDNVFPVARTCAPTPGMTIASRFNIIPLANVSADIALLRAQTQLVTAQLRTEALKIAPTKLPDIGGVPSILPTTETLGGLVIDVQNRTAEMLSAQHTISTQQASEIRSRILESTRKFAGPKDAFSDAANVSWKMPTGPIELQLIPAIGGGTTGPIKPTGTPKVDCLTQYCDSKWVMVRVPTARGNIDGWLEATKVAPADATKSVQLTFVDKDTWLTRDSYAALRSLIDDAKNLAKPFIKIIAVTKPNDDERVQAAERTAYVRSILERQSINKNIVTVRIVETDSTDGYSPVTVELLTN